MWLAWGRSVHINWIIAAPFHVAGPCLPPAQEEGDRRSQGTSEWASRYQSFSANQMGRHPSCLQPGEVNHTQAGEVIVLTDLEVGEEAASRENNSETVNLIMDL